MSCLVAVLGIDNSQYSTVKADSGPQSTQLQISEILFMQAMIWHSILTYADARISFTVLSVLVEL